MLQWFSEDTACMLLDFVVHCMFTTVSGVILKVAVNWIMVQ